MAEKRTKAELLAALEGLAKEIEAKNARLNNAEVAYRSLKKQYEDLAEQLQNRNENKYITIKKVIYDYNQKSGHNEKSQQVLLSGKGYVDWVSKTLYVSKDFTRDDGSHRSEVKKYVFTTCLKGREKDNFYGEISETKLEGTTVYINYSVAPIREYKKNSKKNKDNK